jgi:hypothetical protein
MMSAIGLAILLMFATTALAQEEATENYGTVRTAEP